MKESDVESLARESAKASNKAKKLVLEVTATFDALGPRDARCTHNTLILPLYITGAQYGREDRRSDKDFRKLLFLFLKLRISQEGGENDAVEKWGWLQQSFAPDLQQCTTRTQTSRSPSSTSVWSMLLCHLCTHVWRGGVPWALWRKSRTFSIMVIRSSAPEDAGQPVWISLRALVSQSNFFTSLSVLAFSSRQYFSLTHTDYFYKTTPSSVAFQQLMKFSSEFLLHIVLKGDAGDWGKLWAVCPSVRCQYQLQRRAGLIFPHCHIQCHIPPPCSHIFWSFF